MTPRSFKILLTGSWVAMLVGVIVDVATVAMLPESLRAYRDAQSNEEWNQHALLLLCVGIPLLLAVIASYIGLYRLRRWGRSLWLWTGVVGCILLPAFGPGVYSPWAEPINFIATAMYGAILALAYFSPVAEWIDGETETG